MYHAHRGMVPAPNSRLTELLEQLRQEFENQSRSTGEFEYQRLCPFLLSFPLARRLLYRFMASKPHIRSYILSADTTNSHRSTPGDGNDQTEVLSA